MIFYSGAPKVRLRPSRAAPPLLRGGSAPRIILFCRPRCGRPHAFCPPSVALRESTNHLGNPVDHDRSRHKYRWHTCSASCCCVDGAVSGARPAVRGIMPRASSTARGCRQDDGLDLVDRRLIRRLVESSNHDFESSNHDRRTPCLIIIMIDRTHG